MSFENNNFYPSSINTIVIIMIIWLSDSMISTCGVVKNRCNCITTLNKLTQHHQKSMGLITIQCVVMCCEWPGPRWILWLAWWSWKVWGTQRWLEIPTVAIGPWLVQSSNICWPQENQIQKDGKFWEQISGGRSSWRCPIDVGFIASDDLQPVSRRHTSEPTWDEPRARPPRVGGFRMTFLCETYPDPTE